MAQQYEDEIRAAMQGMSSRIDDPYKAARDMIVQRHNIADGRGYSTAMPSQNAPQQQQSTQQSAQSPQIPSNHPQPSRSPLNEAIDEQLADNSNGNAAGPVNVSPYQQYADSRNAAANQAAVQEAQAQLPPVQYPPQQPVFPPAPQINASMEQPQAQYVQNEQGIMVPLSIAATGAGLNAAINYGKKVVGQSDIARAVGMSEADMANYDDEMFRSVRAPTREENNFDGNAADPKTNKPDDVEVKSKAKTAKQQPNSRPKIKPKVPIK